MSNWFIIQKSFCFSAIYLICLCFSDIFASSHLIVIYFKLSWYPLFCLESRFLSKFDFCEITLLHPLFLPKKEVSNKILQNGQNYPTTAFTFLPMTNFFFASTKIVGRFHRFGQFFGRNSSQKKTQSMWKDIFLFFSDSWDFFWNSRKMPTKKNQISQKNKKISLPPQRFLLVYGIKRGYHPTETPISL